MKQTSSSISQGGRGGVDFWVTQAKSLVQPLCPRFHAWKLPITLKFLLVFRLLQGKRVNSISPILSLVHCLSVKVWLITENFFLIPFLIPETIGIQTPVEFRKTFSVTVWILLFIVAGTYMNCNRPLTYIMTIYIDVWREHPKSLHGFTFYCKHLYSASKGTIIHSKLIFI